MEKKCLDCGDTLRGRTDKKFCSDQCRNNFNNRQNRDSNNFVRNVHGLLRKNRRILADLYSDGKVRVHKDALFALGYNFSFFTHVIETSQGYKFHYCFEYGYREAGDDFLELVSGALGEAKVYRIQQRPHQDGKQMKMTLNASDPYQGTNGMVLVRKEEKK